MIASLMLSLAVQLPCPAPAGHLATVLTETTTDVADVPAGQQFVVALKANPSTGYVWRMLRSQPRGVVRFDGVQYVAASALEPPQSGSDAVPRVGGGGITLMLFTAVQPGTTTLTLGLYPPAIDTPAVRRPAFTVRVGPRVPLVC